MDWLSAVAVCFEVDDGTLPEIVVEAIGASHLHSAFAVLRARAEHIQGFVTLTKSDEPEPASNLTDLVRCVQEKECEPPHVLLIGVMCNHARLPDLGVWLLPDAMHIDFRKGPSWGPEKIATLFKLLKEIVLIAPECRIAVMEFEYPDIFMAAWREFNSRATQRSES